MKKPVLWLTLCVALIMVLGVIDHFNSIRNFPERFEEEEEEKESGADKQMNAWWWSRAYPEPYHINAKYLAAWEKARQMRNSAATRMAGVTNTGSWTAIGPATLGGRILSIAINPKKHTTVFAGSASGGIWKSYTGGVGTNAWQPVETGFPVLGVPSILVNPSDTNIIYAATGEVYRTDTAELGFNVWKARGTYGVGVLRSADGGNTWSQVFLKDLAQMVGIQKLRFAPANYNTVYACCTDGLYRTTNGGGSWTKILDKIYVSDVQINSANTNEIVVAVGNLTNSDKGIYKTTNGSNVAPTWTKITSGLPTSFQGFISFDRHESSNTLFASIGVSNGAATELYRSDDFGLTWNGLSGTSHSQWQYWFAHTAAVDPNDVSRLFIGGVDPYRVDISLKGGKLSANATKVAGGSATMGSYIAPGAQEGTSKYVHDDIHDIEFVPGRSDSVYICCDGGVFLTTNANTTNEANITFQSCNSGLQTAQFFGPVGQSQTDANFFVGGLQDNNTAVYNGATGRWKREIGGDGGPSLVKPDNDNIVLSSRDAREVHRSTNKASTYSSTVTSYWGSVADSRTGFMAPMAWSKSNPNVVYLGSDNLHKSTDAGASWTGDSYSSATNYIEARHKTAVSLAVSPTNENKVYVSTSPFAQYDNDVDDIYVNMPPNFLKTLNGGTSFTSIKTGLPGRFVMDIAVHPTNDDIVWVVLGGYGSGHVYRTMDGGATWTNLDNGKLPDVPTNAIMLDPGNTNIIYVGNDLGVYVTGDGGTTWVDFNSGLWDATMIADLVPVPGNKIRAATHGKGVFESMRFTLAPLPVKISVFHGEIEGPDNTLKWHAGEESGLSHYELEKSPDGVTFEKLATVQPRNASSADYSVVDRIQGSHSFYYRLKAVDLDGAYSYSEVVLLRRTGKDEFKVLGNPFINNIRLDVTAAQRGKLKVNLYNFLGQVVRYKELSLEEGTTRVQVESLESLPRGVYTIEAVLNRNRWVQRVMK